MSTSSDFPAADRTETPDLAAVLVAAIGASVERQLLAHARRTAELVDQREAAVRADLAQGDTAVRVALEQTTASVTATISQLRDEVAQSVTAQLNAAIQSIHDQFEAGLGRIEARLAEQVTMLAGRIDTTEHGITDRMLAMEDRVNEQNGTKIAQLEATVGRIGSGFDDAIGALSQRITDLDNRFADLDTRFSEIDDRFTFVQGQLDQVGPTAVEAVKDQLSSAVGEAMLVRIEMDRLATSVDEKLDKATVRMAEIEARLADTMDVESAVQLDRLEEIERAIAELDPDTIVRQPAPERRPAGEADGVGTSW